MRKRLAMLKVDPLNPHRCPTTFGAYESESSYVELPGAPPLVWSLPVAENRRGRVTVTSIHSAYLKKDKKLWVYTPVGFRIPTDSRLSSVGSWINSPLLPTRTVAPKDLGGYAKPLDGQRRQTSLAYARNSEPFAPSD
jgi:hypothetical protein